MREDRIVVLLYSMVGEVSASPVFLYLVDSNWFAESCIQVARSESNFFVACR